VVSMDFFIYLLIAFVVGGIPFGLLAGYAFGKGDVRTRGSGNIGATNVWRVAGPTAAAVTFAGDIGKGVFAVLVCFGVYAPTWPVSESSAALICGVAAILGHTFSPFLNFRGGKGVNTALGVFITLLPIETLIAFGMFAVLVVLFRYISLGSMVAAITLAAVLWIERYALQRPIESLYLAAATALAVLIIVTHRENIKRLIQGTEHRFEVRKVGE